MYIILPFRFRFDIQRAKIFYSERDFLICLHVFIYKNIVSMINCFGLSEMMPREGMLMWKGRCF